MFKPFHRTIQTLAASSETPQSSNCVRLGGTEMPGWWAGAEIDAAIAAALARRTHTLQQLRSHGARARSCILFEHGSDEDEYRIAAGSSEFPWRVRVENQGRLSLPARRRVGERDLRINVRGRIAPKSATSGRPFRAICQILLPCRSRHSELSRWSGLEIGNCPAMGGLR